MSSSLSILSKINEAKSHINRTHQILIVTLGMGLLTLAIGILGIQLPWQEQRQRLEARYSEEKERSDLFLGLHKQRTELRKMEEKLLLEGGATVLAGQISQLAAQSGLQIESVTPEPEVLVEPYTRFQIEIMAAGNLANILKFLRAVENHRPLFWAEQMDIGAPSAEAASIAKLQDPQKVRFLVGTLARQKASE